MYDLAKLCNDKLCKSAFQKSLAKQNKRKKQNKTKQASKRSQYTTLLKRTASQQYFLQPKSNLRLINNTLRQHQ